MPSRHTADCCTPVSADDEIRFDHLLEQIWICGEEGKRAQVSGLQASWTSGSSPSPSRRAGRESPRPHVRAGSGRTAGRRGATHDGRKPARPRRRPPPSPRRAALQGHFLRLTTPRHKRKPASSNTSSARNWINAFARSSAIRRLARMAIPFRRAIVAMESRRADGIHLPACQFHSIRERNRPT